MSDAIISVENLGKRYRIAHQGKRQHYVALRDVIAEKAKGLFKKLKPENLESENHCNVSASHHSSVSSIEDFWALKDVSFEVKRGEVIGIIGRNGAGKSTLLKILSRIIEPTAGRVTLRGRVASLLEVGTGFHPELTGRENIFLNGAILGMHRAEIKQKFDEIVAFAEVEKFLDTPVKRYSSGMYVRLAFAVAAHLEPEILIVDEVLAVGDAEFQKKCLGKMKDVSTKEGRTVLFVSHNMAAVVALCGRGILMEKGAITLDQTTALIVEHYQTAAGRAFQNNCMESWQQRKGTGEIKFTSLCIGGTPFHDNHVATVVTGGELIIDTSVSCFREVANANTAIIIYDSRHIRLIDSNTALQGELLNLKEGQRATVRFVLRQLLLKPDRYLVGLWLGKGQMAEYDDIEYAGEFTVMNAPTDPRHVEVFPGPYQCRFDVTINIDTCKLPGT